MKVVKLFKKKKCSICKYKLAFIQTKSLITKVKAYYCTDCYKEQAEYVIDSYNFNKEKLLDEGN